MSDHPSFLQNRHLKDFCTIGIGGPARYFAEVFTVAEMQMVLSYCNSNNLRTFILGKGSNTLFDDKGFNGLVILNKIDFLEDLGNGAFYIGAGYSFSRFGSYSARNGWSGLEFASGIPGSVGGAVYMNAGANGTDTSTCLRSIDFVDQAGNFHTFQKDALSFTYRTSSFQSMKGAIVGATFKLEPSETARQRQVEIINTRTRSQPYKDKSAGCMFRNPPGHHAGALIEQCGLKGFQQGGAKVSEMHANFIINTGTGSAKDIHELVELVRSKVRVQYGIEMETEVRHIPYDNV